MTTGFATPQDAEDAFYDALDESDMEAMQGVWDESDELLCLLPMAPVTIGRQASLKSWEPLLRGQPTVDIEVRHLHWIETQEIAIHLVEERVTVAGQPRKQPPMYATNVYRKREGGWRMIMHQNSPTPPPPGMVPPGLA
jgi:uncharacterized protein (TIGR02246 family)